MDKKWLAVIILLALAAVISGSLYFWPKNEQLSAQVLAEVATSSALILPSSLATPDKVKGIYLTGYTFSQKSRREKLINLVKTTELNSVVIDFKDPGGKMMVKTESQELAKWPTSNVALLYDDYRNILADLQNRGIYTIARITTFQDSTAAQTYPELALRNAGGGVWRDYKGVSWLDMTNPKVWDLVAAQIVEAQKIGFDEVQLDYIRFPSDGNISSIKYYDLPVGRPKTAVMADFFAYLRQNMSGLEIPLSIDLFGLTYQRHPERPSYDMGIGQHLATAAQYFDYISPMVYPSHYKSPYAGCTTPVLCPYAVVNKALKEGTAIFTSSTEPIRATTRPWLQDFNLGATYTASMVRAQIQAADDNSASGWLLWNSGNNYTANALKAE